MVTLASLRCHKIDQSAVKALRIEALNGNGLYYYYYFERLHGQADSISNHSEVPGSIPSTDVGKMNTVKYSLPCLMLLYSGELHVNYHFNFYVLVLLLFHFCSCLLQGRRE